jgi:alkanesulfonate monooxygenase SsuD/methylene tetrahydromethanopterin reductase-like flavin-dependent oxidoreductase (luciferase family)
MARVAGEVCDGLLLHPMCSYKYITEIILPAVEQGARKAGRQLKDIDLLWGGFSASGDTEADLRQARRNIARAVSFYGSTRTYAAALELHGWKDLNLQLHELSLHGKWGEMAELVTDDMVETLAETGTQEEVARKIHGRYSPFCSAVMWNARGAGAADVARTRAIIDILHG